MNRGGIRTPIAGKLLQALYLGNWCRRGDSNPHELPHTPLKRARLPVPPLRLVQEGFQKPGRWRTRLSRVRYFFFVGAGDGVDVAAVGATAGAAGVGVDCTVGAGVGN